MPFLTLKRKRHTGTLWFAMLTDGTLRQKPRLFESWFCAVCACPVPQSVRAWGDAMLDRAVRVINLALAHTAVLPKQGQGAES